MTIEEDDNKINWEQVFKDDWIDEIPKWNCPICGEDVPQTFFHLMTHFADHLAELFIKVDKILEKDS